MPRSSFASAVAGGSGPVSTGACQAPQTTAIRSRPALIAARIRLPHVRLPPGLQPGLRRVRLRQLGTELGHRLGQHRERRRAVPARLDHVVPPALRVVVARGLGQRGERVVPGERPLGIGLVGVVGQQVVRHRSAARRGRTGRRARWRPAGRRTRPRRGGAGPRCSACHSGENTANGQNAASPGLSGAYASSATGGTVCSDAAQPITGSASAGPSISTWSGPYASRAATSDRAEPGPWCRIP